mgnify:CR=1 FL=1
MTPEEVIVWARLRQMEAWKFRRQAVIGQYIVDFACFEPKLVIEIDGSQHGSPRDRSKDRIRDDWLVSQGFDVLRFWNPEIHTNINGVLEKIISTLEAKT